MDPYSIAVKALTEIANWQINNNLSRQFSISVINIAIQALELIKELEAPPAEGSNENSN